MVGYVFFTAVALSVVAMVPTALGCTCLPMTNPQKYCTANFAAIAFVHGEEQTGDMYTRAYRISIYWLYKPIGYALFNVDTSRVYTAVSSAACGMVLSPGWHLLTGSLENASNSFSMQYRRVRINLCGWTAPYSSLTYQDMQFLQYPMCYGTTPSSFAG